MSGHSKWHTIKHKKGAADAKRGKVFTRIIKELTVAARNGGGDPDMNPRLRTIIADAKPVNMPADNIKRAIRRGTGEEEGVVVRRSDVRGLRARRRRDPRSRRSPTTRTAPSARLRHTFTKWGGKLGEPNSVARMFHKKGVIIVDKSKAERRSADGGRARRRRRRHEGRRRAPGRSCRRPTSHPAVLEAVKALGIEPSTAEIAMLPTDYVKLEGKGAQQMLKLMDALEEHDDTKNVWSNFDIEEKEIEASLA